MSSNRQSLTKVLEQRVLAIVRRYIDELSVTKENNRSQLLSVSKVYQYVITDGNVPRQKKRNLERMIEKALAIIRDEEAEADSPKGALGQLVGLNEPGLIDLKKSNSKNEPVVGNVKPASSAAEKRKEGQPFKDGEFAQYPKQKDPREPPKDISLKDFGGIEDIINDLSRLIVIPLSYPELYQTIGVQPPRGVLLHGPPGCGKTMLAKAIAGEVGLPFIAISAPSIVSGKSGEAEKKLREIFEEARERAPCLIFMDEIDAITPKRDDAQLEMEKRLVAQMLTCMDDLALEKTGGKPVMIIGATNRPDSLDPALRRPGRFDREICLNVPDEVRREKILRVLCEKLRLSADFDFKKLAQSTSGFVGADLSALATEAGAVATNRLCETLETSPDITDPLEVAMDAPPGNSANMDINQVGSPQSSPPVQALVAPKEWSLNSLQRFREKYPDPLAEKQLDQLYITFLDFLTALMKIQPSSKREGFASVPNVTWADVGILESLKVELQMAIVDPIKRPELFATFGLTVPAGVLLWGPPGCGKTLLAKAVANESGANFISIRGPELLNKYVGESERAVRQVFSRARASIPCIIFFDELDALAACRDDSLAESCSRVVNTLLIELDGTDDRKGIYVIGATNRPEVIDPAMLRPGRLGNLLFVDLPNTEGRVEILKTITKNTFLSNIDLWAVAKDNRCRNFSGADLAALVSGAAALAVRQACFTDTDDFTKGENAGHFPAVVTAAAFEKAFARVRPSISEASRNRYRELASRGDCFM